MNSLLRIVWKRQIAVCLKVISLHCVQAVRKPTTCISMISGCERTHYECLEIKYLFPRRINEGIRYGTRKFVVYAGDVMCCT